MFDPYSTGIIVNGTLDPHSFSQTTQSLEYSDVVTFPPPGEALKQQIRKAAASALGLLLSATELYLIPPEGYGVHAFGFTAFSTPKMLHNYKVTAAYKATPTSDGKMEFACSHCTMTPSITYQYRAEIQKTSETQTQSELLRLPWADGGNRMAAMLNTPLCFAGAGKGKAEHRSRLLPCPASLHSK